MIHRLFLVIAMYCQVFSKKSKDFDNLQFPTSHLEAKNPFGLVSMISQTFGIGQTNRADKFWGSFKSQLIHFILKLNISKYSGISMI
jgi:hypothetical protein